MNRRALAVALMLPALLVPSAAVADGTTEPPTPAPTDPDLSQSIDEDQETVAGAAELDLGHVDLGPRWVDGEWTLMVHDDSQVEGSVWRTLGDTIVRVADTALREAPDDPAYSFIGAEPGSPVHVLPQTQDTEIVWLGWNTQDPEVLDRVDRGVTMSMSEVEGPGDVVVFLQDGGFGEPDLLWSSRPGEGEPLYVETNTHTHANWVFTEPGEYAAAIEVVAPLVDGTEVRTTGTVRFAVGDAADPGAARALPDLAVSATGADEPSPGAAETSGDTADEAAAAEDTAGGIGTGLLVVAGLAVLLLVAAVVVVVRGRGARRRARETGHQPGNAS